MTAPVERIGADEWVVLAAERLRDANVGVLPVIEGPWGAERLVGVVTDRDLVVRVVAARRDPAQTRVRDVMSAPVVTCRADDEVRRAASLMVRKAIRRLVVLGEDDRVAGIISVDDLASLDVEEGTDELLGTPGPSSPDRR